MLSYWLQPQGEKMSAATLSRTFEAFTAERVPIKVRIEVSLDEVRYPQLGGEQMRLLFNFMVAPVRLVIALYTAQNFSNRSKALEIEINTRVSECLKEICKETGVDVVRGVTLTYL